MTEDTDTVNQEKRSFLKKTGATLVGGTIVPSLIGRASADQTNINVSMYEGETWTMDETSYVDEYYSITEDERYAIGSALHTYGGSPTDDGKWEVSYDIDGSGGARRYPSDGNPYDDGEWVNKIAHQRTQVSDSEQSGDDEELYFTTDPDVTGIYPAPDGDASTVAKEAFENVAEVAIGAASPLVGPLKSAAEVFDVLLHEFNVINEDNKNETYTIGRDYDQADWAAEVNQYAKWKYVLPWGDEAEHYAENEIAVDSWNVSAAVNWKITTHAPEESTSSSGTTISSRSPDWKTDLSKAPDSFKKKYGLRKVPLSVLETAGFNTDRVQVVDGNKGWWAAKIPISAEARPRTSNTDE